MDYRFYIFISHARDDDHPSREGEPGWVSQFVDHLSWRLNGRLAKRLKQAGKDVSRCVWFDRRNLSENQQIWPEIEEGLRNSLLFLALYSSNFSYSESCLRELEFFHDHWSNQKPGLWLSGNRSRILTALLRNIPCESWPPTLRGRDAFNFCDSNEPERLGDPVDVRPADPGFKGRMTRLVDAIENLIVTHLTSAGDGGTSGPGNETTGRKIATESIPPEEIHGNVDSTPGSVPSSVTTCADSPARASKGTVFVAHVADTLGSAKNRLIKELRRESVTVLPLIPPPWEQGHATALEASLRSADLSVHLLDRLPGTPMGAEPEPTYVQAQAETALVSPVPQLIWLKDRIEIEAAESDFHRAFLNRLTNSPPSAKPYLFYCGTQHDLSRMVLDQLSVARRQAIERDDLWDVLIDADNADCRYGARLMDYLLGEGVSCLLHQEKRRADDRMDEFDKNILLVRALVVLFGRAQPNLVHRRLERSAQRWAGAGGAAGTRLSCFSVFLPPESPADIEELQRRWNRLGLQILDNRASDQIKPQAVRPLLEVIRSK